MASQTGGRVCKTKYNTDICSCIIVKVTEIVLSILFKLIAVLKGMHQL